MGEVFFADRCVYRIFFKESWPVPPKAWEYSAIVLDLGPNDNFEPGQVVQGLAVMKVSRTHERATYFPVGQVIVEKSHFEESFGNTKSLIFSPPPEGITTGDLSWERFTLI